MKSLPLALLSILFTLSAVPAPTAEPSPAPACNRIRLEPLPGTEKEMVGAKLEGSNTSRTEGYTTLLTVENEPAQKNWTELKFDNAKLIRWLRFSLPESASRGMSSKTTRTAAFTKKVPYPAANRNLQATARASLCTPQLRVRGFVTRSRHAPKATSIAAR
jgi:hypothetical protein